MVESRVAPMSGCLDLSTVDSQINLCKTRFLVSLKLTPSYGPTSTSARLQAQAHYDENPFHKPSANAAVQAELVLGALHQTLDLNPSR